MVRNGNLQYIADTIAIESLASDLPIEKQAGLFEDLGFSGVASSIASKVKSLLVEDDSPMGWVKAIGNLLVSGALFKLHPLLGITYAVANALGVDVIGIGKKVLSAVYEAVKSGANVVMSDVDHHGKVAVAAYNKGLLKEAQLFRRRRGPKIDIPFLPRKGGSKIERVFGNLFRIGKRAKLKTLLVAIVIWSLKTALLGAGIVGAAGLVTSLIRGKPKAKPEAEEKPEAKPEEPKEPEAKPEAEPEKPSLKTIFDETEAPVGLTSTGRGTDVHKNDHNRFIWVVPVFGNIKNTLLSWAKDVYEEFAETDEYDDIIYNSPAFKRTVMKFKKNYDLGASSVMVPKPFTSRKQVVDTFAREVSRKIKGMK